MARLSDKFRRLYEQMTGRAFDGPERPENQILRRMGREFYKNITDQGRNINRHILALALEKGVPKESLQYVFWVIFESRRRWPNMTWEEVRALAFARDVMIRSGDILPYGDGLRVPTAEVEAQVDAAIRAIAKWASTKMAGGLLRVYIKLLSRYSAELGALKPEVPPKAYFAYAKLLFEDAVENYRGWWPDPDMLERAIGVMRLR